MAPEHPTGTVSPEPSRSLILIYGEVLRLVLKHFHDNEQVLSKGQPQTVRYRFGNL